MDRTSQRTRAINQAIEAARDLELSLEVSLTDRRIDPIEEGTLDVVFAKRPWGTSHGRLVWREPLVWAAADTFELVPGASLPLALYREHSVSREAALRI